MQIFGLVFSRQSLAVAVLVFASGMNAPQLQAEAINDEVAVSTSLDQNGQMPYIVGLKDAPLALYDTVESYKSAPLPKLANGRLDVKAPQAVLYVEQLRSEQSALLANFNQVLGRELAAPQYQMQHAFNGMVLMLTEEEAMRIADHPSVALVEAYREYPLNTDVGPTFIGANTIWNGANVPGGLATRGEGVVIGVIDSGANLGSPSFANTDLDGYVFVNPLGAGNYLGWCNPAHPNHNPTRDLCNNKIIGGWDFVDSSTSASGQYEAPGFEDENGHGSHTASIAAGNRRNATFVSGGATATALISGVAPRANLVIYDVCYTRASDGQGLCPNTSNLAAINQVVVDGIIDVVNFSIGGGASPWTEAGSQAFLAAQNAGVYISASAGNSGPSSLTLGHLEPWVTSVAASTHSRGLFGNVLNLTAPAGAPTAALNVLLKPGVNPPYISASLPSTTPFIISPNFDSGLNNDGCVAYPADTFVRSGTGGIALLHWTAGTSACGTIARVNAAATAGAVAVIIASDIPLNAGAGGTVPAWVLEDTAAIAALLAHSVSVKGTDATAEILFSAQGFSRTGDVMASFSSRGPNSLTRNANSFNYNKPDIAAPGVGILAAISRWNSTPPTAVPGALVTGAEAAVGLKSGTSMSSPHNAGAAALLRALRPSWTPQQIKSALVTTSASGVVKENGTTPSDPFDRGAGRVDLTRAAKAGLIMNETGANFTAANPAIGGNTADLNLPSFQHDACLSTCRFQRTVQSTRSTPVTWTATVEGLPVDAATVNPITFTITNSATQSIELSVDSLRLPVNQWSFGQLVLTPNNPTIPVARMAIAVRPNDTNIVVSPSAFAVTVVQGSEVSLPLAISNSGNPNLNWSVDTTSLGSMPQLQQVNNAATGFPTNFFSNQAPTPGGVYNADDVIPLDTGVLRRIAVEGFTASAGSDPLSNFASGFTFKVYASGSDGLPVSNPEVTPLNEIYACVRTATGPNSAGWSFQSANRALFALDTLAATGCPSPPILNAGTRYWISVYPTVAGNTAAPRWAWFRATTTQGNSAVRISPLNIGAVPTTWTPIVSTAPALSALALNVQSDLLCGASWMSMTPTTASLGTAAVSNVNVNLSAVGLSPGTYRAPLCLSTNGTDPDESIKAVPVTLTVIGDVLFGNSFEDAGR